MAQSVTIEQLNPYIRVAMQSVLSAGSEIKRRIIFDYELIYIEKGTFVLEYGDVEYQCPQGCFILLRPGISHGFCQIVQDLSQPHIHFDVVYDEYSEKVPVSFKDMDMFTREEKKMIRKDIFEGYPAVPFVEFTDRQKVLELFYDVVAGNGKLSGILAKARLLEILDMMIRDNFPECFAGKQKKGLSISAQMKEYMDAGQGMQAQLADLEKQFSYSKYYLDREFKKEYGVSLMAYRNEKRMQRAKELLKEKRVSDVAEELGFSSIYVFSRAYKNYFGCAPSDHLHR